MELYRHRHPDANLLLFHPCSWLAVTTSASPWHFFFAAIRAWVNLTERQQGTRRQSQQPPLMYREPKYTEALSPVTAVSRVEDLSTIFSFRWGGRRDRRYTSARFSLWCEQCNPDLMLRYKSSQFGFMIVIHQLAFVRKSQSVYEDEERDQRDVKERRYPWWTFLHRNILISFCICPIDWTYRHINQSLTHNFNSSKPGVSNLSLKGPGVAPGFYSTDVLG